MDELPKIMILLTVFAIPLMYKSFMDEFREKKYDRVSGNDLPLFKRRLWGLYGTHRAFLAILLSIPLTIGLNYFGINIGVSGIIALYLVCPALFKIYYYFFIKPRKG